MVFRKPYGFLIKHFKLIHLIITAILVYLVSFGNNIYSFLNSCIENYVYKYTAYEYVNYSIYIWIGVVLILFFIIYWLFKYKDKPRKIYVFSIVGYIILAIYMFILYNYLSNMSNDVLDQKVLRGYRDLTLITLGFQYLIILIMFIRGLGFNIKKFNFDDDRELLDLKEEDEEEVELDVNINTASMLREVRKQKRELSYFYEEYKILILGILSVIVIIIGYNVYNYLSKVLKVYNQNEVIGTVNYITVKNSYYSILEDNDYIIVNFDVFRKGDRERLDVNSLSLKIGNKEYYPNKNICYKFNDIGNCYKKQYITNNSSSYILVYEIDNLNLNLNKTYLLYKESYDNVLKVKLDLENYEY